jgi:pseudouridine-5'-phosphate glycosidase
VKVSEPVATAVGAGRPVVALETAVLTHGLPQPLNVDTLLAAAAAVREAGAEPAVVGVIRGELRVGLSEGEVKQLADGRAAKANLQSLAACCAQGRSAGTSVSATIHGASQAGIAVMATGGIGGVHLLTPQDVSSDLYALSSIRMLVVCSGPKAVLDFDATIELLETHGVALVGYKTGEVPAFYSASSGFAATTRVDEPEQAAELFRRHCALGLGQAVVLCQPPPAEHALPRQEVEAAVDMAVSQVHAEGVRGDRVTPRLLERVTEALEGRNLTTNRELLVANASLAAQVAASLAG